MLINKLTKIRLYSIIKVSEMGFLDETCEKEPFYCIVGRLFLHV